jgi:alkylated DNA repair dioxygenase AlkB
MRQQRLLERLDDARAPRVVLECDGLVTYARQYLDRSYADRVFDEVMRETAWRQDEMRIFGRWTPLPRLTAWYGDPGSTYTYSGIRNDPLPWTRTLDELRCALALSHGVHFNSVLLNRYRSGYDRMGWHADDEPELEPVIASLSLGATRRFQLRHREARQLVTIEVEHGSLVTMSGATQHCWIHQVPRDANASGERINLTFRVVETNLYALTRSASGR